MNNESLELVKRESLLFLNAIDGLCKQATEIKVSDVDSYEAASEMAKQIKATLKETKAAQDETIAPLKANVLRAQVFFAPFIEMLASAEKHLKQQRIDYDAEQQRIRDEQQRKLEERMREEARLEAEKAALAAIKAGNEKRAEAILELAESEPVAVPQLAPVKPMKGTGLSYRDNWKWDLVDVTVLPREYFKLVVDEEKITSQVRIEKDKCQIPGVAVRNDRIPVQRGY